MFFKDIEIWNVVNKQRIGEAQGILYVFFSKIKH